MHLTFITTRVYEGANTRDNKEAKDYISTNFKERARLVVAN